MIIIDFWLVKAKMSISISFFLSSNIFGPTLDTQNINFGAIAQLVERMDGIHEVTGSTPVSSILRQSYFAKAS